MAAARNAASQRQHQEMTAVEKSNTPSASTPNMEMDRPDTPAPFASNIQEQMDEKQQIPPTQFPQMEEVCISDQAENNHIQTSHSIREDHAEAGTQEIGNCCEETSTSGRQSESNEKPIKRSLKRKYDSMENCTSPKVACVVHHSQMIQFTVLKPADSSENETSPLSRSLSCSSFMELTCES